MRDTDLLRWAVRFCRARGTSWSLEQVAAVEVQRALAEERERDPTGVDFGVFDLSRFGVPQTRRRLLAGSPHIIAGLRAAAAATPAQRSVYDVIGSACRGTHVRNATTNTFVQQGGVRVRIPVTETHPSFARSVSCMAYTVTRTSQLRWWTPGDEGCKVFSPRELACLQGFPASYELAASQRLAYEQVGNAIPPPVMELVCKVAMEAQGCEST